MKISQIHIFKEYFTIGKFTKKRKKMIAMNLHKLGFQIKNVSMSIFFLPFLWLVYNTRKNYQIYKSQITSYQQKILFIRFIYEII